MANSIIQFRVDDDLRADATAIYEKLENGEPIAKGKLKENLENRILIFNDEVNDCVIENYILHILSWNREDRDLPVDKRKDILLILYIPP